MRQMAQSGQRRNNPARWTATGSAGKAPPLPCTHKAGGSTGFSRPTAAEKRTSPRRKHSPCRSNPLPPKSTMQKPPASAAGCSSSTPATARARARRPLALRCGPIGRGKAVKIYQFMKVLTARFGEHRSFEQIGIAIEGLGDGFSWQSKDLEHSAQLARDGWDKARAAIVSGAYFLVVLDEITYPLIYGWLPLDNVLQTLRERPRDVHLC